MKKIKYFLIIFILSAACVALSSCGEKIEPPETSHSDAPSETTEFIETSPPPVPEDTPRYIEFAPQEF